MHVGAVGYVYDQLTADDGCFPALCPFRSRVVGVGPQVGFIIPGASVQTYLNFKGYYEFDAQSRPSGWNAWVTLPFSPSPPTQSAPPPIITKGAPHG
jgi:hypothetical protein